MLQNCKLIVKMTRNVDAVSFEGYYTQGHKSYGSVNSVALNVSERQLIEWL